MEEGVGVWWVTTHTLLLPCLRSEGGGGPQGRYVLLLASEARINYLFTLIHLVAANLRGGEAGRGRESAEQRETGRWKSREVARGRKRHGKREKERTVDRQQGLFTQTTGGLGKSVLSKEELIHFSFHWWGHEVNCIVFSDGNYTPDE